MFLYELQTEQHWFKIQQTMQKAGYTEIGSGKDATVWAKDEGSVIKILMPEEGKLAPAEKVFLTYYKTAQKHKDNPHFMKFIDISGKHYTKFDIDGETFYQIAVEKLQPLPSNSFNEALVWSLSDLASEKVPVTWADAFKQISDPNSRIWQLSEFDPKPFLTRINNLNNKEISKIQYLYLTMQLIYQIGLRYGLGWDLHTENAMQRSDGTIVITDPWYTDVVNENFEQGLVEGGAETSWSNDTDTITLQDILELTKHIKQINLPINDNLKSKLLHWDGNPEEIERINQVTVSKQFPILVMLDGQGQIDWILDGNHRLHKAIQSQAKTIPAKLIKPSDLNDKAKKIFNIKEQGVAEGKVAQLSKVLYHGGPKPITNFKIPPYGVYFSPHIEWAKHYGDTITTARVGAKNIYLLDYENEIDEEIMDALFDRDYTKVADYIKQLQAEGYDAMQSVSDSEMIVVFPGTPIQVLNNKQGVAEVLSRDDMFYTGLNDPNGPRTHQDYVVTNQIDIEKINQARARGVDISLFQIRRDAANIGTSYEEKSKFYRKYRNYLRSEDQ